MFGLQDVVTARTLITRGENPDQVRVELHKLDAMVAFAEALMCRRRVLLGYFGEAVEGDCGNCDVCLDPPELYDATEDAQKALSTVYRLHERFGWAMSSTSSRGTDGRGDSARSRATVRLRGGANHTRDIWGSIIRQLIHRGYLVQDIARYSVLKLTPAAGPVLRGEERVLIARPRAKVARQPKREEIDKRRSRRRRA